MSTTNSLIRPFAAALCGWIGLATSAMSQGLDPADLFAKLSPSVWVVVATDKSGINIAFGSAVVIERERLITNCHVLKKAQSILVKRDNTTHAARLEFADTERDLCTLSVKNMSAPAVKIAPLASAKVGQKIITIGAPRGLELTLSDGLISSLRRDKNEAIELIQISAPISPGSSGGGLFNMNGDLLGVPFSSLRDSQNLNFAIPAEWIKDIAQRSALALAKQKEDEANKALGRQQNTKDGFSEREMKGAELYALIRRAMRADPQDVGDFHGSANIDVSADPYWKIALTRKAWNKNAQFSYHVASSELCITEAYRPALLQGVVGIGPNSAIWRSFVQCYKVYEFAPEKFALREKGSANNTFVLIQ